MEVAVMDRERSRGEMYMHVPAERKYQVVIHMFLSGTAAAMDLDVDTMDDLQLACDECWAFLVQDAGSEDIELSVESEENRIAVTVTGILCKETSQTGETLLLMKEILEALTLSADITPSADGKAIEIRLVVPKAV